MTVIDIQDLSTGYRRRSVTSGITTRLAGGELTCLLGPNGAGKSTLLKTLCGFLPPVSGRILVDGTDLRSIGPKRLAGIIGVVLTERPAAVDMTVDELVAIGRTPYTSFWGNLSEADRRAVDEAIALVGIEDLRRRRVNTLSDGERQKALIAKTLAQDTDVVLLDEPTAFLDYPSKVDIMLLLCRIARDEGKTVFMSTHDLDLALQVADKVWLLDRVHGLNIGTPAQLAANGMLAAYFSGRGLVYNALRGGFEIDREMLAAIRR